MMEEIRLDWTGEGLAFDATLEGIVTPIDGDRKHGASPVALLLEALTACAAADVVDILKKGRQDLRALVVEARGQRRESSPRYFTRVEMDFTVSGDVDPAKAKRAVQLSFDTYCSVYHTLRKDMELEWTVTVEP